MICSSCLSPLELINAKSFHWGFAYGLLGFLIPAEVIKYVFHSSIIAFISGVIGALVTILLVALYVKKNTFSKNRSI
jgi:ABC-type Fe3+ transport system permease subunit